MQIDSSNLRSCSSNLKKDLDETLSEWNDEVSKTFKTMNLNFEKFCSLEVYMCSSSDNFIQRIKTEYEDNYDAFQNMIDNFKKMVDEA